MILTFLYAQVFTFILGPLIDLELMDMLVICIMIPIVVHIQTFMSYRGRLKELGGEYPKMREVLGTFKVDKLTKDEWWNST